MSQFTYRAKKGPHEIVTGVLDAVNMEDALNKMDQLGLFPIHMQELGAAAPPPDGLAKTKAPAKAPSSAAAPAKKISQGPVKKVRSNEVTLFARQLASLIRAGVPILRGLWIISEQSSNENFRRLMAHAHEEIKNGKQLSSVLSQYPKVFPPVDVAMIKAGEGSGALEEMLIRIANYRQKQEQVASHIRAALAYPMLMAVTGAGTIIFMLTFVIPKLSALFSNMGDKLPLPTRILMSISAVLQRKVFWVSIVVAVAAAVLWGRSRSAQLHELWSRVVLKLPFFKDFVLKVELASFSRTFEMLLRSGIPILKAIEISAPIFKNSVLRREFAGMQAEVAGGASFSRCLKERKIFPLFVTNLVSVGEESGKLEEAMQEIALYYEQQTDEAVRIMTSLFEPIMILVMGLIVGFIVISMFLPMFELNFIVK